MDGELLSQVGAAYVNDALYRNVRKEPATADLLDDLTDDPEDLAAFEEDHARLYADRAVNDSFSGRFYPGRYGDGSFAVWYAALSEEAVLREYAYWSILLALKGGWTRETGPAVLNYDRTLFAIDCRSLLMDLRGVTADLTHSTDYALTQQIGRYMMEAPHPGILAPSARLDGGVSAVMFVAHPLSNTRICREVRYAVAMEERQVTVFEGERELDVIDCREWFPV